MEGGGLVVGRYWCHMCSQEVNPVTEVVEMKCPQCNSGFIEHLEGGGGGGGGEEEQGGPTAATAAANDPTTDLSSERALSLWAPILLGMLASHRDDGFLSLLRRRQQRSSAVLQLLHGLQESNNNERGGSEREGHHMILVNPFSQAVIVRAPFNNADNGGGGGGDNINSSSNSRMGGGVSLGDYFVGPGLEQLLQHLAENDPNRYGTPPAQKEAVEAMPTVEVGEKTNCPVCLEEFEIGEEAREMPCRHMFHGRCIVQWLEMHSSCPLCRFQMPVDGDKDSGSSGGGGGSGENNAARRFWLPVPLPFSGLFSFSLNSQQSNMMIENGNNSSFVLESSPHTNTNENGTDYSSSVPTSSSEAPTSSSSTTAADTTTTTAASEAFILIMQHPYHTSLKRLILKVGFL